MTETPPQDLYSTIYASPCGPLVCIVQEDGTVVRITFARDREPHQVLEELQEEGFTATPDDEATATLRHQLEEYFAGRRQEFDIAVAPRGTEFQRQVWDQLLQIPFGETRTYGEIAGRIGRPGASRAVGRANGANPIPVVIPCHRVIGADGTLTGFGGGLPAKTVLLQLEGAQRTLALG